MNSPFSPFPSRELKRLDFQAKNGEGTGLIVLLHFLPWEERGKKKREKNQLCTFPKRKFQANQAVVQITAQSVNYLEGFTLFIRTFPLVHVQSEPPHSSRRTRAIKKVKRRVEGKERRLRRF